MSKAETSNFKPVRSSQHMQQEALARREQRHAEATQQDVDDCLKESIVERVTPFAHLDYSE